MNKKERVEFILRYLDKTYPETPIPLNHQSIYELLIAVLLSAQCTDERVNRVTPILFKRANNPKKMIRSARKGLREIMTAEGLQSQIDSLDLAWKGTIHSEEMEALSELILSSH